MPRVPPEAAAGLPGWMEDVRRRLAGRAIHALPEAEGLRRAGVLLPLFVREGALWIVFTLRTDSVEHHRGQISFPGGGEEEGDGTLWHTALRESEEELGIRPDDALALGRLSPLTTVTNFYVEPFVAAIPQPYSFRPAPAEIAEVLEVPIPALLDPAVLETRRLPGREEPVLFYRYEDRVIWGATARMLAELLEALGGEAAARR
ncbi:MAG TPA: CoA pyrophosphatase [Thermoanaerobaculia bacterium]|nr:CoA pyrophosphatase [Thermoanaerobaculia bacterium]